MEGARTLARTLRKAGVGIADLKAAHAAAGQVVAERAKALAPRQSGALAGGIRASKQQSQAVVRAGGGGVVYAGVQQWGWAARNIGATYFLTNGLRQSRDQVIETYLREVDHILAQVKGA